MGLLAARWPTRRPFGRRVRARGREFGADLFTVSSSFLPLQNPGGGATKLLRQGLAVAKEGGGGDGLATAGLWAASGGAWKLRLGPFLRRWLRFAKIYKPQVLDQQTQVILTSVGAQNSRGGRGGLPAVLGGFRPLWLAPAVGKGGAKNPQPLA